MQKQGTLTGKHVLMMVVAFFGVMIVANVIFISAAVNSFPGVTQEHAYERGLQYNDKLADRAAQAALGWKAELVDVVRQGETGEIVLRMTGAAAQTLPDLSVTAVMRRPANTEGDQALTFVYTGDGLYRANVVSFAPGAWDLTAHAENSDSEAFDFEARIIAP